jgi:hypothetical protein
MKMTKEDYKKAAEGLDLRQVVIVLWWSFFKKNKVIFFENMIESGWNPCSAFRHIANGGTFDQPKKNENGKENRAKN